MYATGMDAEGIYRISGKTNDILRIKKEFDHSEFVSITCLPLGLVINDKLNNYEFRMNSFG